MRLWFRIRRMQECLKLLSKPEKQRFSQGCYERRKRRDISRFLPAILRNELIRLSVFESLILPKLEAREPDFLPTSSTPHKNSPFTARTAHALLLLTEIAIYVLIASITSDALATSIASYVPITWAYRPAWLIGVGLEISALLVTDFGLDLFSKISTGPKFITGALKAFICLAFSVAIAFAGIRFTDKQAKHRDAVIKAENDNKVKDSKSAHDKWLNDLESAENTLTSAKVDLATADSDYLFQRWKSSDFFVCEEKPSLDICPSPAEGRKTRELFRKTIALNVKVEAANSKLTELKKSEPSRKSTSIPDIPAEASNQPIIFMWLSLCFSKLLRFILRSST